MSAVQRSSSSSSSRRFPKSSNNSSSSNRNTGSAGSSHNYRIKPPTTRNNARLKNDQDGLLVLRANKKGTSGGLLAAKPAATAAAAKPRQGGSVATAGSTYQGLRSALVPAEHTTAVATPPDAWGTAEKKALPPSPPPPPPPQALDGAADSGATSAATTVATAAVLPVDPPPPHQAADHFEPTRTTVATAPAWDEYGGRGDAGAGGTPSAGTASASSPSIGRDAPDPYAQRHYSLDQGRPSGSHSSPPPVAPQHPRPERKLWEPNDSNHNQHHRNAKPPPVPSSASRSDACAEPMAPDASNTEKDHPSSLIHLASYEDSDRGPRDEAPRMLFDPKSGSMVAAPTQQGERCKKRRQRGKKKKLATDGAPPLPDNDTTAKTATTMTATATDAALRKPLKGRKDSISSEKSDGSNQKKGQPQQRRRQQPRRLPRTCGVLYTRSRRGRFVPADGCLGDLGYGCHSVPGGRVHNGQAYQKFMEEHAEIFQQQKELYENYHYDGETGSGQVINDSNGLVTLETGFTLPDDEQASSATHQPQPLEWVKGDDKLELVTGEDDSPTLKPTAKEWAPSQAALAAAAAAAAVREKVNSELSAESGEEEEALDEDYDDEEEEEDEEEDGHSGLGFDPMQGMDFMSSPTHLPHAADAGLTSVDLKTLSLESSAFTTNETSTKRNIFAFGSTTWGASAPASNEQAALGWGSAVESNDAVSGLFASSAFDRSAEENPARFLPSTVALGHSWGTGPIPGLNLEVNREDSASNG